MSNTLKYLGLGLTIGILSASLIIGTGLYVVANTPIQPAATPLVIFTATSSKPASTLTPKPLQTLAATPTPTWFIPQSDTPDTNLPPSPTPDAVQSTINNGGLIFTGALSNHQQIALYKASLNYVQPTVHDSIQKAIQINGVGYGDPSNICGPLAFAIMQDAGLLNNTGLAPYDFWLLESSRIYR